METSIRNSLQGATLREYSIPCCVSKFDIIEYLASNRITERYATSRYPSLHVEYRLGLRSNRTSRYDKIRRLFHPLFLFLNYSNQRRIFTALNGSSPYAIDNVSRSFVYVNNNYVIETVWTTRPKIHMRNIHNVIFYLLCNI